MIASVPSGAINVLAALLEAKTGQQIAANRAWRLETALKPVMRDEDCETLEDLVAALLKRPDLSERVTDALLNQESSFFRDAAVLETLADAIGEIERDAAPRRPRIWSAGCSTGQEPLSLAMLLTERCGLGQKPIADIYATDISGSAIARARTGRFTQFEIQRGLPVRRMMRWFDQTGADWTARPELMRKVIFRQHNLVNDPLPALRYDLILCRNVLMYFSPAVRRQMFDRFAEVIRPGGLLVLGAGETVIGQTDVFTPDERYRGLYRAVLAAELRATG